MNAFNERAGVAKRWTELPQEWLNIIDRDRARADGFPEHQINQMERRCREMERLGQFSPLPALVQLPTRGPAVVCETVAEAIERLRAGWWQNLAND
jgi:hypothetical protein